MDRIAIALIAGVVGGAAGALAVRFVAPPAPEIGAESSRTDEASMREMRDQIVEIRRIVERPTLATLPAGTAPAGRPITSFGEGRAPATHAYSPEEVTAIAERAAETVLERRAEKDAAAKPPPQKRAPLAEVARELALSASQETEIREAYREATDRFLKVLAEPESDAETLRRELNENKGNKAKQQGLMMKYLPKMLGKLPDVMAIQGDRDARVQKALGTQESQAKFQKYKIDEEDPFGLDGNVSVGVGNR